jgi:hypothetical protein
MHSTATEKTVNGTELIAMVDAAIEAVDDVAVKKKTLYAAVIGTDAVAINTMGSAVFEPVFENAFAASVASAAAYDALKAIIAAAGATKATAAGADPGWNDAVNAVAAAADDTLNTLIDASDASVDNALRVFINSVATASAGGENVQNACNEVLVDEADWGFDESSQALKDALEALKNAATVGMLTTNGMIGTWYHGDVLTGMEVMNL